MSKKTITLTGEQCADVIAALEDRLGEFALRHEDMAAACPETGSAFGQEFRAWYRDRLERLSELIWLIRDAEETQ